MFLKKRRVLTLNLIIWILNLEIDIFLVPFAPEFEKKYFWIKKSTLEENVFEELRKFPFFYIMLNRLLVAFLIYFFYKKNSFSHYHFVSPHFLSRDISETFGSTCNFKKLNLWISFEENNVIKIFVFLGETSILFICLWKIHP